MLIQIHLLQNYAPSNLNRDDTGSPKDAIFGSLRRGRISSQCLKRSMRKSSTFEEAFKAQGLLGMRTKRLPTLVGDELKGMQVDEDTIQAIVARLPEFGRESTKKNAEEEASEEEGAQDTSEVEVETKQLIFIAPNEIHPLAESLLRVYRSYKTKDSWPKAKIGDITKALEIDPPKSVDIAMFGRMTTSGAFEDVQAAVQVAHALSTNALTQEFDYYTAVDDLSGESGAGMIGDVEFNSSTYYKYLNVHWEQLVQNLGGDRQVARQAVLALLEAAATAQPSGKQNSFAAHSLPDLVLVEVGERNLPVSLVNAFVKPARASADKSLMDVSAEKLASYLEHARQVYGLDTKLAFVALEDYQVPSAQAQSTWADLKSWLATQLPEA